MRTGMDAEIDMTLYLGLSARIWMTLLESTVSWSLDKCIYTSHSGFFLGFVNDRLYLWQTTSARNGSKRYAWPPFCMTLMTALQQQMSSLHALSIEVPRIEVTVWRCHAVYSISQSHFALRKAIPEKSWRQGPTLLNTRSEQDFNSRPNCRLNAFGEMCVWLTYVVDCGAGHNECREDHGAGQRKKYCY